MDNSPTKIVDAVHAELLTDIQKLRLEVKQFTNEVPNLYNGVKKDVDESAKTVQKTFEDFHSMAQAIALHINKSRKEGEAHLTGIHKQNTDLIKKSLEPYTKYFWLLIGLSAANSILLVIALITIVFLR